MPPGHLAHLVLGILCRRAVCLVHSGHHQVRQHIGILRVDHLRLDHQSRQLMAAVDCGRHRAAAGVGGVFPRLQLLLQRSHILLHLLCLAQHALHIAAAHTRYACFHVSSILCI